MPHTCTGVGAREENAKQREEETKPAMTKHLLLSPSFHTVSCHHSSALANMQNKAEKSRRQLIMIKVLVAACMILVIFLTAFDGMGIVGQCGGYKFIDETCKFARSGDSLSSGKSEGMQNYGIKDAETALIMTLSSIAHTIALGLVWIFGDSFKRRGLFLVSVIAWIVLSLLSILLGSQSYMTFVILRSLASAASSVHVVLVPVILADLFEDRPLGIALMFLSISETVAILLTGIVSSWIVTSSIPWQSGLIAAPFAAMLPLILLLFWKKHITNVGKSDQGGVARIFSSAFGILSIKSYLLMAAVSSLGMLNMKSYTFWIPSVSLLAWKNVPEVFYGLSYAGVTAINSFLMLIGTVIGMPTIIWFAQSWRHGTGPFSGKAGYLRAYPIVVSAAAAIHVALFILIMLLLDKNYIGYMIVTLFIGVFSAVGGSLSQQMLLMVVPSSSRAAAVALSRLISGLVSTPAAQIVGMVSDAIRGDSTLPYDQFHAFQKGLLLGSVYLIGVAICNMAVIFFFPSDCQRAEEKEQEEKEPLDEKSLLNGKGRSESILESFVRSRTATVNGLFD